MTIKKYILMMTVLASTTALCAQSRRVPLYDAPASPMSLSLGGSRLGEQSSAAVYGNPSALFAGRDSAFVAGYSFADIDDQSLHTVSASYRQGHHVLMGGVRYFAQGTIDRMVDIDMKPVGGRMHLYSYSVDLGYAQQLGAFSVYGSVGIASEKTVNQLNAYSVSVGASYAGQLRRSQYLVGGAVRNVGFRSTGSETEMLSPFCSIGGSLKVPTWQGQTLGIYVDGGVYLPDGDASSAASWSGGVDYMLAQRYSLRMGGHLGDHDDFLSAGVGCRLGRLTIDAAVKFASEETVNDIYMVGAQFAF